MKRPLSHLLRGIALAGITLVISAPALAVDCAAIMNMVDVGVPAPTIISTMKGSSHTYTAEDVSCLKDRGAPADVVGTAEALAGTAAPAPVPSPTAPTAPPPDAFDSAPSLGDDLNGNLMEEEMDSGGGPQILEELIANYRAKKYLTASNGLYTLLADNTYPDQSTKIEYYLAKSLYDMGLYHGSQHYFMQVVRSGPQGPYFKYALPRLVAIAELTGNDAELLRIVDKIPPEAFPRAAKNHLYYLKGRKLFEDGELSDASTYLQQISRESELYMRARYFDGIINNERRKLKTAVLAFRDVMQSEPPVTDARRALEIEDTKDLALMNIARIYYGLERFDNADNYYSLVRRDSTFWPESLFERAWSKFMVQDLNQALGLLLTVNSPYYASQEFLPEVEILRALTFFNLCEYGEVENQLNDFGDKYQPMVNELEAFLEPYKTPEGRKLSDQAFDAYFEKGKPESRLESAMFARILRNRDLSSLVRHLDMMDEETVQIDAQKAAWRDSLGEGLKKVLAKDRERYKRRAGLLLLREMAYYYEHMKDLLFQAETIKFEVVDAQRLDYEFKSGNPDVGSEDEAPIDYATDPYTIYWPFNGEFWKDELGYYEYTERGSCQ
ncbi:MAG: hypothetical protein ACI8PZ_000731 [Myxococcota bacterium]|jgi:hypothetical protein